MIGKFDEEYFENQIKLNLSESYTNEEIKLLKKTFPEISNIIYSVQNNEHNNTDNSRSFNGSLHFNQTQNRFFSSIKKNKTNSNISFFIDKEKFYSSILNSIIQIFEKENKFLLSKSLSLIMDEILNLSKILKQNLIYNQFFRSIRKTKLYEIKKSKKSFSQIKNNNKYLKVKFNPSLEKNDSKYNIQATKLNLSNNNQSKLKNIDIENNLNVKKLLSFEVENEIKDKNNDFSKSVCQVSEKEKEKNIKGNSITKDDISNIPKRDPSIINIKNKVKININLGKSNKNFKTHNRNVTFMNNSTSNYQKTSKKVNNNYFLGNNKISLKKAPIDNKKYRIYDFIHNKCDYNLTNIQNKKNFKEKSSKKYIEKVEKNQPKKIAPSCFDPKLYQNIETQEFNIFKLEKEIGRENVLPLIGYYVFKFFGFDEIIKYNKYEKWCQKIADGYVRKNFYHNDLHASDITQTCLLYFKLGEIESVHKFSKSNICSLFLSCMCHDYQHPGVNNNFLKETSNKIAIRYNDASILENMHISKTFKIILNNREYNVFEGIERNLYKEMRKQMISCVLATDMAFHNIYVDFLKYCVNDKKDSKNLNKEDNNNKKDDENQKYMNLLIHSADISNPTKLFDIYFEWAKLVVEEFWAQGDKEKKLNLPCSCDREKVTIYQSQLGFINFIEIPFFSLMADLTPKLKFFYDNLLNNKNILLSMQEKEKQKEKDKDKEKEK